MNTYAYGVAAGAVAMLLSADGLGAQGVDRYREFQLRSSVAAVSTATGVAVSEVKALHRRPAVIQELTWKPRYTAKRSPSVDAGATEQIVFRFYNDQLFRMTVAYDRERTRGLTDADMIDAISAIYGSRGKASTAGVRKRPLAYEEVPGVAIARWGDADTSVVLYRNSSYTMSFALVMTAEPLAELAGSAAARADVLDAREAPKREAARVQQEADDRRAAEEKVRSTNKGTFKP